METSTRYLTTIEALMIDNSRLTKELQDIVIGKMPANVIQQEMAEQCFAKIASVLGPSARGNLLDEITVLCDEFLRVGNEYVSSISQIKKLAEEKEIIGKIVNGDDDGSDNESTPLIIEVARLRGVIEVIKTRMDRLSLSDGDCRSEIIELKNSVTGFLNKNRS